MNAPEILFWYWRNGGFPCLFREITGLYCPGCGGTRAAKALLHGKVLLSFFYHPFVIYCAGLALWSAGRYLYQAKKGKQDADLLPDIRAVYVGIVIIGINFLVKNYFLLILEIDILQRLPSP